VCTAGKIVLFGGRDGIDGKALGDTWTFDGATWSEATTGTGPPPRHGHAMTSLGSTVVLFGGEGISGTLGDTWTYDGVQWTASVETGPPARSQPVMTTVFTRAALFGGQATAPDGGTALLDDTWAFDGKAWTAQPVTSPPPARYGAAAATLLQTLTVYGVMAGGTTAAGPRGDLWNLWPLEGGTWSPAVNGLSARSGHAMATLGDTALNGNAVLFGGQDATGTALGDTWMYDGNNWIIPHVPGPPPRSFHAMATLHGQVVLYGGLGPNGALDDTWTFDGTRWTQVVTPGPPARQGHAMAALP
jgi:hypothetical protein